MWQSLIPVDSDTSSSEVRGQLFDQAGLPVGDEFQANTYTTNSQTWPSVTMREDGTFVVVWMSRGYPESAQDGFVIRGQQFDPSGNHTGEEFQVNINRPDENLHYRPSVAAQPGGDFVVVWEFNGIIDEKPDYANIRARRFDSNADSVGEEFQVNTISRGYQFGPRLAVDPRGKFVVVWESNHEPTGDRTEFEVQAQWFDRIGNFLGGEFQVNTYTPKYQTQPSVAVDGDGDFVVVWKSDGSQYDDDGGDILGQRFITSRIFRDGFESGDTSAWSSAVP